MTKSRLKAGNVWAGHGRTSMRLEPELWDALKEICVREDRDRHDLVRQIEASAGKGCRTSAVRVFILNYFRTLARNAQANTGPGGEQWT